MKILFITNGSGIDYQSDCLFHGLVKLGHDVTDSNYMWYLSRHGDEENSNLYGMGFTIGGNLPDRSGIDRSDIKEKISDRYFDIVIYGSIHRCSDYIDEVLKSYKPNEIIFIDGEDIICYNEELTLMGLYFKRELYGKSLPGYPSPFPISFAIPSEKLYTDYGIAEKTKVESFINPERRDTYIYTNETDYYNDYRTSLFGTTMKKAGWDCMRHYEIIANGCLPYFRDFEECPKTIMTNWPSDLQIHSNRLYSLSKSLNNEYNDIFFDSYKKTLDDFFLYAKNHLTTENLADYVLGKIF